MRIPFDISKRPQIESGEYKVETNFGSPVEIVCWNRRDDTANKAIVGIIRDGTVEEIAAWNIFGKLCDAAFPQNPAYDLFLVTPEPELTEWQRFISACLQKHGLLDCGAADRIAKESAADLLAIARKQLQPEIDAEIEKAYKTADEVQYRKGREEALKDLPRWKKIRENGRNYSDSPQFVVNGRYLEMNAILNDVYEIALSDLEKLPKED